MMLKEHRKQVLSIKEAKTCVFLNETYVIPPFVLLFIQINNIMRYVIPQYDIVELCSFEEKILRVREIYKKVKLMRDNNFLTIVSV